MATKKVNVYLTNEEKVKAHNIQNKFHVSLSTLASTSYFVYCGLGSKERLEEEYFIKTGGNKTSIKPKLEGYNPTKTDMAFTNALHVFIGKLEEEKLNYTEEGKQRAREKIYKFLQEKRDQYWNHNEYVRNTARAIKQNKEYYKKILGE